MQQLFINGEGIGRAKRHLFWKAPKGTVEKEQFCDNFYTTMCLELNKMSLGFQNVQLVSPAECMCSSPLNGAATVQKVEKREGKKQERFLYSIFIFKLHILSNIKWHGKLGETCVVHNVSARAVQYLEQAFLAKHT